MLSTVKVVAGAPASPTAIGPAIVQPKAPSTASPGGPVRLRLEGVIGLVGARVLWGPPASPQFPPSGPPTPPSPSPPPAPPAPPAAVVVTLVPAPPPAATV